MLKPNKNDSDSTSQQLEGTSSEEVKEAVNSILP